MYILMLLGAALTVGLISEWIDDSDDDDNDTETETDDPAVSSTNVLTGTNFADEILGDEEHDVDETLLGLEGDDTLQGMGGDDTLDGGPGDDILDGGPGNDDVQGGAGDDYFYLDAGDDVARGGADNDTIGGGAGDDTLRGNDGDDIVNGEDDDDVLLGNEGNDTLTGGEGNDLIKGGYGNDVLYGGAEGVAGGDPQGEDTLKGGHGDDELWLTENDVGEGGEGADTFMVAPRTVFGNVVQITDYNEAEDQIVVVVPEGDTGVVTVTGPPEDTGEAWVFYDGSLVAIVADAYPGLSAADIEVVESEG